MVFSLITSVCAAAIPLGSSKVYTISNPGDKINLSFTSTKNDSFYRITIKNNSVNDKLFMTLTNKYDEELANFGYWSGA